MVVLKKQTYVDKATLLYGSNPADWKFKCPSCKRVQSGKSILEDLEKGIKTARWGVIEKGKGHQLQPETFCYGEECNWSANGLFNTGILLVFDEKKTYNANLKQNCHYVFPLADSDFSTTEDDEGLIEHTHDGQVVLRMLWML